MTAEKAMTPEAAWAEAMKFENRHNPYRFFDEIRKQAPVAHVGNGAWAVTGFAELHQILHDPRLSSDKRKIAAPPADADLETNPVESYGRGPMMIQADPPDHDRARRQAMRHFGPPETPDIIPSMEAVCQQIANGKLDEAKAAGKTRIDIVDDYAYWIPTTVIFRIMGVPMEDEPRIHHLVEVAFDGADLGPEGATPEGQIRREKSDAAKEDVIKFFGGLVERYKREPDEKAMLSRMIHDIGPDGPMTDAELMGNATLLVVAGHDSTVNLIAHTVLTLLRNPGSIETLRSRPELVPAAIEESLRIQSSVQFFPKYAIADIDIGGVTIPKGSPVFPCYGAANRDPRRFADPEKFDLERMDNQHFGWGRGIHACFGGMLARIEVNVAIETFLRRIENPRLVVDPPPYRRNQIFRGPRHMVIDCDGIKD